ncbi:MAG: methenyltetrahydromethanopterin cyclohydrolase [Bacillota bacterium]
MKYSDVAKDRFHKMVEYSPANACAAHRRKDGIALDAGVAEPGGWTAAKLLIEGLIGGRGQVNFGDMEFGPDRLPTLELFLDDPVMAYQNAYQEKDGLFGIQGEDASYALGLGICDRIDAALPGGNFVLASSTSILGSVFAASRAIPLAIGMLLKGGVRPEEIQWAWGVCPLPILCDDENEMQKRMDRALKEDSVVSVWVRGEDEALQKLLNAYDGGCVRIHNLKTAKTLLKA